MDAATDTTSPSLKQCRKCGVYMPPGEFPVHNRTSDKLSPYCRACTNEKARKTRAARRDEEKSDEKIHHAGGHPRPAKSLREIQHLLSITPIAQLPGIVEAGISSCRDPSFVRSEIESAGTDYADPFTMFYVCDIISKYHGHIFDD